MKTAKKYVHNHWSVLGQVIHGFAALSNAKSEMQQASKQTYRPSRETAAAGNTQAYAAQVNDSIPWFSGLGSGGAETEAENHQIE